MQNTASPDRESGAFLKTGLSDILGAAARFHTELLEKISRHNMEHGLETESEELIILMGKRDEMENILTPLTVYADHGLEEKKSADIAELRERIQLLIKEPRYVGNHEHDVAAKLKKLEEAA